MKALVLVTLAACSATVAFAQERGRVLSATPVTQQVAVPQQVCRDQPVAVAPRNTGAGAVIGALAGGLVGNAIGSGGGRAAATAAGVVGGAMLGNQTEAYGPASYQNVRQCSTQTFYQSQTVGYNVVYEYRGRNYTTQTAAPPGDWIALNVQPAVQGFASNPNGNYGSYDNSQYNGGYEQNYGYAPPAGAYDPGYNSGYNAGYAAPPAGYPAQPVYQSAPAVTYSGADYVAPLLIGAALGAGVYYATRSPYRGHNHYYPRGGHGWRR